MGSYQPSLRLVSQPCRRGVFPFDHPVAQLRLAVENELREMACRVADKWRTTVDSSNVTDWIVAHCFSGRLRDSRPKGMPGTDRLGIARFMASEIEAELETTAIEWKDATDRFPTRLAIECEGETFRVKAS